MSQISTNHEGYTNEQFFLFSSAPSRVVISLDNLVNEFCATTELVIDSQQVNEITRELFDVIDNGFKNYSEAIKSFPLIGNLIDNQKYVDSYGFGSAVLANLRMATYTYGMGVYFACNYYGIFIDQRTPYILETMKGNTILLLNSCNLPK